MGDRHAPDLNCKWLHIASCSTLNFCLGWLRLNPETEGERELWVCRACDDGRRRELRRAVEHERSAWHIAAV